MTSNNKHTVFCVIGRTGSGKTKIVKQAAEELNMEVLKSYTTRKPRKEEMCNGTDHIFIDDDEFEMLLKNEELIAYTEINNNKYFATTKQLGLSDFYVIDPKGYDFLVDSVDKSKFEIIPVYIKTSYNNRKKRYIERDDALEESFIERDNSEREQFDKFETDMYEEYEELYYNKLENSSKKYIINNDEFLEDAVADLELLVLEILNKNK